MKQNRKQKWQDLTLKSLEAWLRRLPEVRVPEALKARLLAAVPDSRAKPVPERHLQWHRGAWDFGVTAAAAVLIFALLFMVNYGFSVPSRTLLTDLNDTSLCYPRWDQDNFLYDQNNALIDDTNYAGCDSRP